MQQTIVLASNNAGKIKEFNALFSVLNQTRHAPIHVVPQSAFNVCEVEETGLSFVENALIKARNAAQVTGFGAIADDSGIEVDYLNGQPGIYSARYSTEQTDSANNTKLLTALHDVPEAQRSARFRCVLVYLRHSLDPSPIIAEGTLEGFVLKSPQGENGFGYDPLLWLPDYQQTAAELPLALKNTISHRAQALKKLINAFAVGG